MSTYDNWKLSVPDEYEEKHNDPPEHNKHDAWCNSCKRLVPVIDFDERANMCYDCNTSTFDRDWLGDE